MLQTVLTTFILRTCNQALQLAGLSEVAQKRDLVQRRLCVPMLRR